MRRPLILLALLAVGSSLPAQGALSVQGFGYPPGQLGAGAIGIGGSNGEMDPASALNPASIGMTARFSIYAHFQPEYRQTKVNGASDDTRALRFPSFLATGGRGRFTVGISFSTFLDRTWANSYADSQVIAGETVPSTLRASSDGAITDTRFAVAYVVNQKFQVGLGVHALTGQNRIAFGRSFPDSMGIGDVTQRTAMSYSGQAISAGVLLQPSSTFLIGASARFAGDLDVEQSGAILAKSDLPLRYGVGVAYLGIPNTTIAARVEQIRWTDLEPLGTALTSVFNATEFSLGAESAGPAFNGALTMLRLGFRSRTLPFGANGDQVSERAFTGGFGIPLSRGRSQVDFAVQRASRSGGGASERAWLLSLGLGIRP